MQIIDDEANHNIVSWLPEGNGFTIHDKKQFEQVILPKFMKKIHYSSFTRRMNRWNFVLYNISHTSSRYFHPQFIKGDYDSAREMTPEPQRQWRRTKDGEWETREPSTNNRNISKESIDATIESNLESYRQLSRRKKPISLRDPSSATNDFYQNSNNVFRSDHSSPRVNVNYPIQHNLLPHFHHRFAFQSMASPSRQSHIREDQSTAFYGMMHPGQSSQFQAAWYYY